MRCSDLLCRAVTGLPLLAFVAGSAHARDLIPLIDIDPSVDICTVRTCSIPPEEVASTGMLTDLEIIGTSFTIREPTTVTALGVFDEGLDGLMTGTPVGIFSNEAIGPIARIEVPAGNQTSLVGSFRVVEIEPLVLLPDQLYSVLSIGTPTDAIANYKVGPIQPSPIHPSIASTQISNTSNRFTPAQFDEILEQGGGLLVQSVALGPNVFTSVPEPGPPWLLCLCSGAVRRRRRTPG